MSTYREQWKDPRWQRKRLEAMEAVGWECENCGDKETTLNVHHKFYVKGRMVWEYEIAQLSVLCEPCHLQEHEERQLLNQLLAEGGQIESVVGLVGGFLAGYVDIDPGLAYMAREGRESYYEIGLACAAMRSRFEQTADHSSTQMWWRSIVRSAVAEFSTSPTLRNAVAEWDELKK